MKKTKSPKISANKLGEYIESSPSRRKKIVHDQKYPKGFIVTRYNDARSTIIDYFINGRGEKEVVKKKIESLLLKSFSSDFRNQDNDLSIQALEIFNDSTLALDLSNFTVSRFGKDLNKLSISGVDVSVQPEILIKGKVRGVEFCGAIKIHISKSNALTEQSGKYVATLVHRFLEKNYSGKNVRPEFCISMDIFTGKYFTAPRSFKMLRKEIDAACAEIRLLWNDL
jgi:hypothetical protein